MTEPPPPISDEVRAGCAWVAERARSVRIETGAVETYARGLPVARHLDAPGPELQLAAADREAKAAFVVCLDAINFGSGWWPTIRKRPGLSGYATMAAGMTDHFRSAGAWSAAELTELTAVEIAAVLRQDDGHPLMEDYARSLRDVGAHLLAEFDGRFEHLVEAARGSALALAGLLGAWDAFADVSTYEGRAVPFFKRAQIGGADLDRAGVVSFPDLHRLTAFADNLVPHVLRLDGVLRLDPTLEAQIEAGELLVHGAPAEVELRACTVHAVELLAAATGGRPSAQAGLSPAQIDAVLWERGRAPHYKARPRPRSRNTAY